MSAIRIDAIEVDVTHSDCIPDNQIGNSQNYTKTYFVSSDQDFSSFSHFFGNAIYKVRRDKVVAYKALMHKLYDGRFAQYQGKGAAFDASCDFFINQTEDPVVEISIREKNQGDDRNFMKFNDGREPNAKAFKALLYEGISRIMITRDENEFGVYPVVLAQGQALPISANEVPVVYMRNDGTCVSRQLITYGAPGTGKSHKTKLETEAWKKNVFRTTFHPDSDYSTFVGAYKPTMKTMPRVAMINDGKDAVKAGGDEDLKVVEQITYDFVAQAFVKAYVLAWRKMEGAGDENGKPKPEPVFLVIEEINRGNCAQIFGDLFQLLDRNDAGYSEYPIDADADLRKFLAKKGEERLGDIDANALSTRYGIEADLAKAIVVGEKLVLPPNFLIRATMNTSDQSLFPIDSAFKRRWDWEYVPILEGVDETTKKPLGWKIAFDVPKLDANGQPVTDATGKPEFESYEKEWWDFVLKVNEIIGSATHSEDKKLGYFFVKAEKKDGKLIVSDKKILEKVIFYLWNDVFKDIGLGKIFADKDGGGVEFHRFFDAKTGAIDSVLVKEFVEHVLNAKPE